MNSAKVMAGLVGALVIACTAQVGAQAARSAETTSSSPGVVNINTATVQQLSLLPGIGPTRAEAIITARERRPFRTVQELTRVRGIGRSTFRKLEPYIRVSGDTTLRRPVELRRQRAER
jgi:competence protein ComEA